MAGWRPFPFGPAPQPLGRVCMTTPHPYLYSSLPIVTCSTGRFVRLDAYRLYLHALRRLRASRTPLDASRLSSVHFSGRSCTYMDTQLSRACPERSEGFMQSMTARPCRSSFAPFDGTISSERGAPTACTRLGYASPSRSFVQF